MKLAKGLGNFKGVFARKCVASNDPFFASVESGNVSREQPQPGSFFQRPRDVEERELGSDVGLQAVRSSVLYSQA